jgi:hypothetical protein
MTTVGFAFLIEVVSVLFFVNGAKAVVGMSTNQVLLFDCILSVDFVVAAIWMLYCFARCTDAVDKFAASSTTLVEKMGEEGEYMEAFHRSRDGDDGDGDVDVDVDVERQMNHHRSLLSLFIASHTSFSKGFECFGIRVDMSFVPKVSSLFISTLMLTLQFAVRAM